MGKQTIKQKIETLSNKWEQIWIFQKESEGNERKTLMTSLVIIIIYTKDGVEFNAHVPRELFETATPLINWKIWDI